MARRTAQSRELVRLSPIQFSLSVSIVVVLLGAAAATGYFYGMKKAVSVAAEQAAEEARHIEDGKKEIPETVEKDTSVTFYSALTEPRENPMPAAAPASEKADRKAEKPASNTGSTFDPGTLPAEKGAIILQVASYKERAAAQKLLGELSDDGYSGSVVRADLGQRGIWFRVRIGPFDTENDAEKILDILRQERKLKGYIVR